jgi:hypothetical protein
MLLIQGKHWGTKERGQKNLQVPFTVGDFEVVRVTPAAGAGVASSLVSRGEEPGGVSIAGLRSPARLAFDSTVQRSVDVSITAS